MRGHVSLEDGKNHRGWGAGHRHKSAAVEGPTRKNWDKEVGSCHDMLLQRMAVLHCDMKVTCSIPNSNQIHVRQSEFLLRSDQCGSEYLHGKYSRISKHARYANDCGCCEDAKQHKR